MSTKKEEQPVNEVGQAIQTETVSGHNVQPAHPARPLPRARTSVAVAPPPALVNGIRPEFQPETANVRSQIPELHKEDLEEYVEQSMDEIDKEYLEKQEKLNEEYRKKREGAQEKALQEQRKQEEKAEQDSQKEAEKARKEREKELEKEQRQAAHGHQG